MTNTVHSLAERFKHFAAEIWGEKALQAIEPHLTFVQEERPSGAYAAVLMTGLPKAIGGTLTRRANSYKVMFSERLLEATDPKLVDGILKHEVIHLGYPKHDDNFRALCKKFDAPISESMAHGKKPTVEVKDGARYKPVKEFDDFKEAVQWAKLEARNPQSPLYQKKIRIVGAVADRLAHAAQLLKDVATRQR